MIDTSIQVKTDQFDGPLGLLLYLIEAHEMDIRDLDLGKITGQYLDYLDGMKRLNFDVAGDFLYMLATLLLLKSHSAISEEGQIELPVGFEDQNLDIASKADLIRRLEELKKFQNLGGKIWNLSKQGHEIFVRPKVNKKEIINSIHTPLNLEELMAPMMDLLRRNSRQFEMIKGDKISLTEKLKVFKEHLSLGNQYEFENLLTLGGDSKEPVNILVTFLCLLELARLKKVALFQNEPFSTIYLEVLGDLALVEESLLEAPPLIQ